MRNCSFQGASEGILLGVNEQARAAESTMYRKKPTPNEDSRDKAQDVSESRRQDF